jgi:hypothetical protein
MLFASHCPSKVKVFGILYLGVNLLSMPRGVADSIRKIESQNGLCRLKQPVFGDPGQPILFIFLRIVVKI